MARTLLPALIVLVAALAGCGGDGPTAKVRPLEFRSSPLAKSAPAPPAVAQPALPGPATPAPRPVEVPPAGSRALGRPDDGRLVNGLQLPESGPDWVTWDPILHRIPNRPERRWGTDALLAVLVKVLDEYRRAHPEAPPVLVADLSRPSGGVFDRRYGGLGHASHQNGLDVDVVYPRRDGLLREPGRPADVDRRLAQDLVDRFVAAGATFAFVGTRVGLRGPPAVVQAIPYHDDHVHVRIANPRPEDVSAPAPPRRSSPRRSSAAR